MSNSCIGVATHCTLLFNCILWHFTSSFVLGDKLTYVDLALLQVIRNCSNQFSSDWMAMDLPLLKAFKDRMEARPNLAKYFKSDRYMPFEGNSMFWADPLDTKHHLTSQHSDLIIHVSFDAKTTSKFDHSKSNVTHNKNDPKYNVLAFISSHMPCNISDSGIQHNAIHTYWILCQYYVIIMILTLVSVDTQMTLTHWHFFF